MKDKPIGKSKTIWFNIVLMVATIAGMYEIQFLQELLATPESKLIFASVLQSVGNIILRAITNSGVKIPGLGSLPAYLPVVLIVIAVGAVGCKKDDIRKAVHIWDVSEAILITGAEVSRELCDQHTGLQVCEDYLVLYHPGIEAIHGVGKLVNGLAGVAEHFANDDSPETREARVRGFQRALASMPPDMRNDLLTATQAYAAPEMVPVGPTMAMVE